MGSFQSIFWNPQYFSLFLLLSVSPNFPLSKSIWLWHIRSRNYSSECLLFGTSQLAAVGRDDEYAVPFRINLSTSKQLVLPRRGWHAIGWSTSTPLNVQGSHWNIAIFFFCWPASEAVMKQEMLPANNARSANLERRRLREGAIPPRMPNWMPMDVKLEKPHKA